MEKNTHHYCFNSFFGERMKKKLVIIGAGGYGQTVADIAHQENEYEEILFLDDNRELLDRNISAGICSNYVNYKDAWVYPAFGNNENRMRWIEALLSDGYQVPTIIHESAYVSPRATVGIGTIVLPKAVINTDTKVGKGCIINCGSMIDHGCVIEDGCHICLGAVVKAENRIRSKTKIDSGEVIEARSCPVNT